MAKRDAKRHTKVASSAGLLQRLDGGSCVNQRSILVACELFGGAKGSGQDLTVSDLLEALWVLELMIVSRNISYDGTLPRADLELLEHRTSSLSDCTPSRSQFFGEIRPRDFAEQVAFARSAALSASSDVNMERTRPRTTPSRTPLIDGLDSALSDDEAERFFAALRDPLRGSGTSTRLAVSEDEMHRLLSAEFRGSKCVAGILSLGRAAVNSTLSIPERLAISPALAAGMLVNRFRFSYVRQLSFGANDVYVPAARWKHLSEFHAVTFTEAVRRRFQRSYGGAITEEIQERLDAELGGGDAKHTIAIPPIGLFTLMESSPTAGPRGVVRSALQTHEDYGRLFREFWHQTREIEPPVAGWTVLTGNHALDRVSDAIERTLSDKLGVLHRNALNPQLRNSSVVDRYVTPILRVGTAVAAVFAGAALGSNAEIGPDKGSAVAAGGAVLADMAYASVRGKMLAHLDQYRTLDAAMLRSFQTSIRLDRLEERVQLVLGRRLIW